MSKPPFLGDLIKLSTSSPHKTTQNTTSSHETHKTTTTTDVKRNHRSKSPYDWQEFPRPPEMALTSSNKTSLHATHPTMMMMTTTTTMMTTTADVKQNQHWKIPYVRQEHSKIPYEWTDFPRPTEMSYSTYLPHTDIYAANLHPNAVLPQPHSTNTTCTTQHADTIDYRKLAQQAFYHKANL